ncbi:MAG TPA: SDR family oxidoreductase [Pyrinomonadaceae bacterium]|nr:SDR family oxidoreductase [Pyrinomonadaceae bacterium]
MLETSGGTDERRPQRAGGEAALRGAAAGDARHRSRDDAAPGPVWTPLITSTMPHEKYGEFGANTPAERPGQPAELAPVYVFLASQESSYVCGGVVGVTGGKPLP